MERPQSSGVCFDDGTGEAKVKALRVTYTEPSHKIYSFFIVGLEVLYPNSKIKNVINLGNV